MSIPENCFSLDIMDIKVCHWLLSSWPLLTHCSVLNGKEISFFLFTSAGPWRISVQTSTVQDKSARRTNLFLINWLAHSTGFSMNSWFPHSLWIILPSLIHWIILHRSLKLQFLGKVLQFLILLSQHTQWFQRLLHNITLGWNSNLSSQWDIYSDIMLGLLNLQYYLICACIDLKHRNFMLSASQWLIKWYICSVILSILRKVINQECSYLISLISQEKSFCWRKEIHCPFSSWCFSEQRNFFECTELGQNVEFQSRFYHKFFERIVLTCK